MQTNCQKCGATKPLAERRGYTLCSVCMTEWIQSGLLMFGNKIKNNYSAGIYVCSQSSDDDQLPELEAAQNLLEGEKYEQL